MGAEHAVGRAPTGVPTSVDASRAVGPSPWPAFAHQHQDDPPAGTGAPGPSPTTGAVPVVPRRRPRLPLSVVLVVLGVALVVVCALLLGTRVGAGLLAAELLVSAVVRAVRPAPGPNALAVRSRALDVVTLTTFAVLIAVLAAVVPGAS